MGSGWGPSSRSSPSAGSSSASSSGRSSGCPCCSGGHGDITRSVLVVCLVLFTACLLGYAGRVIGTWSNVTVRRHHLGHVDAALGVGVAVVAVLLSVWVVAAVILSPNSRFTSLDAAVARSDILHSIDGVLPQAPSIFNDLQTFLNDQGFPQVFSTAHPALDAVGLDADRRRDQGAGRSRGLLDGQDPRHRVQQRAGGIGLRRRPGPGRHQRPRRGGGEQRQHAGAARQQRVQRDHGAVRSRLRPGGAAHQRAPRARPHHQLGAGPPGHAGRAARLSRGPGPHHRGRPA